jgi:hypothetical protein
LIDRVAAHAAIRRDHDLAGKEHVDSTTGWSAAPGAATAVPHSNTHQQPGSQCFICAIPLRNCTQSGAGHPARMAGSPLVNCGV